MKLIIAILLTILAITVITATWQIVDEINGDGFTITDIWMEIVIWLDLATIAVNLLMIKLLIEYKKITLRGYFLLPTYRFFLFPLQP